VIGGRPRRTLPQDNGISAFGNAGRCAIDAASRRQHLIELRRHLTLHARQDVRQAAESESAAAKVEKTVAALEREEAAMREQMLVP
jgi:hypothetical protein